MIHGGALGRLYMYDDFVQANGTALDSYGLWTAVENPTAEVQSNAARFTIDTGATTSITSTDANRITGVFLRGTFSASTAVAANLNGCTTSLSIAGGVALTITYPNTVQTSNSWVWSIWLVRDVLSGTWFGRGIAYLNTGTNQDPPEVSTNVNGTSSGKGTSLTISGSVPGGNNNGNTMNIEEVLISTG